jgi:hypothetical protein
MYGKPAMTCFKYQVYLYGSEAITYLSVTVYFERLQSQHYESSDCPHPPLQAALPPPVYGSITFTHLEENFSMVKLPNLCKKSKGKAAWLGNPHM